MNKSDKNEVIERLKALFGKRLISVLRKRSGMTRPTVSNWVNHVERNSPRLLKAGLELIEEEEAAERARLAVRQKRLRETA